jgi:hypothetical protein
MELVAGGATQTRHRNCEITQYGLGLISKQPFSGAIRIIRGTVVAGRISGESDACVSTAMIVIQI